MTLLVIALAVLAEDPRLVPTTHTRQCEVTCNFSFRSLRVSGLNGHQHTQAYTPPHTMKNKKIISLKQNKPGDVPASLKHTRDNRDDHVLFCLHPQGHSRSATTESTQGNTKKESPMGDNAGAHHPCSWGVLHKNEEGMLSLQRKQRIVLVVSDKVKDLKLLSDLGKQISLPQA